METYTSWGVSGVWRVYGWLLACFSLVLGDTEHHNDISGQWHNEWPLDTWVESPIFYLLRETFLPLLLKKPVEYPEPDQDDTSRGTLLPTERNENAPPSAPPPQKAVLFAPPRGEVCHLKWWLTKFFEDDVSIFHLYDEMGKDEHTEMQLKFQDSRNTSVFITTPKVGGTGLNLAAVNHAVITPKFSVLNEQRQAFARVVQLGQNRVPYTQLLNTGPGGYDNCSCDLYKYFGMPQMRVLHCLMSQPIITTSRIYRILEARQNHMQWLTENGDTWQSDEPSILDC